MPRLAAWYQRCTVHVNLTPTGSGDKVALEAMSCGQPCIAANVGFAETFGLYEHRLLFRHGDAEDLARKLESQLQLSCHERMRLGAYLRERVVQWHRLENLAYKVTTLFQQVRQGSARDTSSLGTSSD